MSLYPLVVVHIILDFFLTHPGNTVTIATTDVKQQARLQSEDSPLEFPVSTPVLGRNYKCYAQETMPLSSVSSAAITYYKNHVH